jgi:hypothetical protein
LGIIVVDNSKLLGLFLFITRKSELGEQNTMPLQPVEIKIKILRKGDTLAGLARRWKEENPDLHVNEQVLSRVIHRRGPYVYPEVRQLLADYLGVRVSQIGRAPAPKPAKSPIPIQSEHAEASA